MKVLVLGSCVLDIISRTRNTPYGTKMEDVSFSLGGMAYNVYNILEMFNNHPIFGCPIGTGRIASVVEKMLEEKGITPIHKVKDKDNGVCMCFLDEHNDSSYISKHSAEYVFDKSWFKDIDMSEVEYIYISGLDIEDFYGEYFYGNEIIDFLKESGKKIFFAMGPRLTFINKDYLKRMYELHPIIHINDSEARRITGLEDIEKAADYLYRLTDNAVIITLGDKGCYIRDKKKYYVEGYPDIPVDTIGAGDSHAGAILASLTSGLDLKEAAKLANIIASETIKQVGSNLTIENFLKAINRYHALSGIALYSKRR